jgi:hypothetical protein
MSIMIEVYYRKPENLSREKSIREIVAKYHGEITYKESDTAESICLTAEFESWEIATAAAALLMESGEHVEGPCDYGDS